MTDGQRVGKETMMTPEERDVFLRGERICRVATVSAGRGPHVSPLWFVWNGKAIWLMSLVKSQRWTDLERDPRMSVVVDTGHDIGELRGVELSGKVERVGEVPRAGEPNPELEEPERLFADKYMDGGEMSFDMSDTPHGWLRLVPERIVSWDYRKLGQASGG